MLTVLLARLRATSSRWQVGRYSPQQARRDSLTLLVVGLLMLVVDVQVLGADASFAGLPGGARPWQVGLLCVATTVLLAKQRRPVVVLVAVTVLTFADGALGGSVGMYLVLFDALFTVALRARPRARAVVLGVLVALVVAAPVVTAVGGASAREVVTRTLTTVALVLPPWWWGTDVRRSSDLTDEQARRADAERERADLARAHADDVARIADLDRARAVQEERARMARDLHDVVAGHLSAVAIHAEAALAAPPDAVGDREALAAVRAASLDALAEMRSMIVVLRQGAAADATTAPAGLTRVADLDVDVVGDVPTGLPAAVDQAAFRILQEAATNARKHGSGRASVRFGADDGGVRIVVENPVADDAATVDAALTSSTGLQTMRERAVALGGTLTAGRDGATWCVDARLPVRPQGVPR